MGKRIIVCSDGTWNTPDQTEDGQISPTNVVKIARAISPRAHDGTEQVVFYHSGVGTAAPGLDHLIGGALGVGLSRIIEDCYRFVVDNFSDGDQLYLFGFSRGAYAARSLAGLIRNCGILTKANGDRFHDAYGIYRRRDPAAAPDGPDAVRFIQNFSRTTTIKFIGVWDTVGALGIPAPVLRYLTADHWEFHDVKLGRSVENAYQALAIDERREVFQPCLWEQQAEAGAQQMEQRWFAGVHCNVGGGYEESGLSDIALLWMKTKAEQCGLELDASYVATTIKPDVAGILRNSKTGLYTLKPDYIRPIGQGTNSHEAVHPTAEERRKSLTNPQYCPPNLTGYLDRGGLVAE